MDLRIYYGAATLTFGTYAKESCSNTTDKNVQKRQSITQVHPPSRVHSL